MTSCQNSKKLSIRMVYFFYLRGLTCCNYNVLWNQLKTNKKASKCLLEICLVSFAWFLDLLRTADSLLLVRLLP